MCWGVADLLRLVVVGCISGFGKGFAPSCRGGVYGMRSGTACGGPLGGVAAAHDMLVVQLIRA